MTNEEILPDLIAGAKICYYTWLKNDRLPDYIKVSKRRNRLVDQDGKTWKTGYKMTIHNFIENTVIEGWRIYEAVKEIEPKFIRFELEDG